jgi:hypothetical protein
VFTMPLALARHGKAIKKGMFKSRPEHKKKQKEIMDAWIVREPVLSWFACAIVSFVSIAVYSVFLGGAIIYFAATVRPSRPCEVMVV